jgi:hypothetical protein
MTYNPKYVEDFVKVPNSHLTNNYKDVILTSVIISTIQQPSKIESTNYAYDLEMFGMPKEMQKQCFVITFDENMNTVNGGWFFEGDLVKISPISEDQNERFIFEKCLNSYELFLEKLKVESDDQNFNA